MEGKMNNKELRRKLFDLASRSDEWIKNSTLETGLLKSKLN